MYSLRYMNPTPNKETDHSEALRDKVFMLIVPYCLQHGLAVATALGAMELVKADLIAMYEGSHEPEFTNQGI